MDKEKVLQALIEYFFINISDGIYAYNFTRMQEMFSYGYTGEFMEEMENLAEFIVKRCIAQKEEQK